MKLCTSTETYVWKLFDVGDTYLDDWIKDIVISSPLNLPYITTKVQYIGNSLWAHTTLKSYNQSHSDVKHFPQYGQQFIIIGCLIKIPIPNKKPIDFAKISPWRDIFCRYITYVYICSKVKNVDPLIGPKVRAVFAKPSATILQTHYIFNY